MAHTLTVYNECLAFQMRRGVECQRLIGLEKDRFKSQQYGQHKR